MDRVRSSGFPTTAWTVVSRARSGADSEAREALAFLCAAYWLPLYSFARRLGNASEDALDLTQGYFALLIEKDYLADVRLREGRFRAFLLTSFRHFVSKERDRARALKRGGGHAPLSIDAAEAEGRYAERAARRPRSRSALRAPLGPHDSGACDGSSPPGVCRGRSDGRVRAARNLPDWQRAQSAVPRCCRAARYDGGCDQEDGAPAAPAVRSAAPGRDWRHSGGSRRDRCRAASPAGGRKAMGAAGGVTFPRGFVFQICERCMSGLLRCRDCGTPLMAGGGLDGRCARCLLELAIEDSQGGEPAPSEAITVGASSDAMGLLHPTLILGGRYRLLRVLGRGGQGEVWHAFDLKLRVEVALKSLRPDLIRNERARELLRREVRAARQVVSPNVCRVFDLIVEDGHEMVSMEFVDGTTLAELLRERGPLDISRAGEIAAQLLAGLEAIHAAGLVHRDLKPENVMLTLSRRVVVMDFGIARNLHEMQAETIAGTPGYMSPEQAAGLPLDARADVFSAAVVLAEMVRRRQVPPRTAEESCGRSSERTRRGFRAGPWSAVLRRALGRSPEGRYPSAGALARALELQHQEMGRADESPYPGLLSFTQADARFFFGREQEVESLLRQLRRPRLRAVIGPSGAGKSSFLRAGLLPALPAGWSALACTPADRPFAALAQALAPELVGDSEAVQLLPRFDDAGTAILLARRWRQHHDHALLVVDQAEELFTLNDRRRAAPLCTVAGTTRARGGRARPAVAPRRFPAAVSGV